MKDAVKEYAIGDTDHGDGPCALAPMSAGLCKACGKDAAMNGWEICSACGYAIQAMHQDGSQESTPAFLLSYVYGPDAPGTVRAQAKRGGELISPASARPLTGALSA